MKKLIALLMTLVMLTGTCAAFAEAEAVDHQAALEALLEDAGVELQPGDLSRPFAKALNNAVTVFVLTHTVFTDEQRAEWEAAKQASYKEFDSLLVENQEESITNLNKAIDGLESFTPFAKSMLKRAIFTNMLLMSEITHQERQVIQAIYNALEQEMHEADEARVEEIVAGVKAGMEGLVGLHNVRDDMMFILKFLHEKGAPSTEDVNEERLVHGAGEILKAADQVMGDQIEDLDAALAKIPAFEEEMAEGPAELWHHLVNILGRLDEEELAEAVAHIEELANAVLQDDQEAMAEQVKHVFADHMAPELEQRDYEALLGMDDEELRVLAIQLLVLAHNWQNGNLDGSLQEELGALELNWSDLSEEDMAAIRDAVGAKVGTLEIPEEARERVIEGMTNDIIAINGFSDEEKAVADSLMNLLIRTLDAGVLDAAQLAELENEMETLLYELGGDTEKYQALLEKTVSIHEGVDVNEWMTKMANLSDTGKSLLTTRFLEHFDVYNMLPKGSGAKMLETDKALFEAIQNLELNGMETTTEQLQALEKAVYDVLSQLDMPVEALACEVAKTVANSLIMSSLTEEEQETITTALKGFSLKLGEGKPEDIRALRNYQHKVMHLIEEGKFLPHGGQA